MSALISRVSDHHLNLKDRDVLELHDDQIHQGYATLSIALCDPHGKQYGNFYLNEVSLELLENLKKMIGPYIKESKARAKAKKKKYEEELRTFEETGTFPWEQTNASATPPNVDG